MQQWLRRVVVGLVLLAGSSLAMGCGLAGCSDESSTEVEPSSVLALRIETMLEAEPPKLCTPDGSTCQPLEGGERFTPPAVLDTERGARLTLELDERSTLEIDERTRVALTSQDDGYDVAPQWGHATLTLEPEVLDGPLTEPSAARSGAVHITLADRRALIDGSTPAVIALWADDADRVSVTVRQGRLRLDGEHGESLVLRVGQTARVVRSQPIDRRAVMTGEAAPVDAVAHRNGEALHEAPRGMGRMTARVPGTNRVVTGVRLVSHEVQVSIRDGLARTEVIEEFHNDTAQVLEGRFVFPLPTDASISRLALWVDERLVEGEMLERDRAARIFKGIVDDTVRPRDPALLEWVRGSEFSLKIFPILPGKSRRVLLAYNQALDSEGGRMRYRYPMSLGSERATLVDEFSIQVVVADSQLEPADVRTPLYPADIRSEDDTTTVSYSAASFSPALSFDVEFELNQSESEARASYYLPEREQARLTERSKAGDQTSFVALRLRASLPADTELPAFEPLDRALVLDTSHSQSRTSFDAQVAVAVGLLERMDPDERFVVFACDSACDSYPSAGLVEAHQAAVESVTEWLQRRELRGASDVAGALVDASRRLRGERSAQLVYLGDGAATAGELSAAHIAERVADEVRGRGIDLRLVGVGHSIDAQVLQGIATGAGGTYEAIAPGEIDESRVDELAVALRAPVIEAPQLELPSHMTAIHPARLPNLRLGQELVVVAQLLADTGGEAVLRGQLDGQPYRVTKVITQPTESNPLIPRLWAQGRIAELQGSSDPEAIRETVDLSVAHHVMSRHTALLVLENDRMFGEFGIRRTQHGGEKESGSPTAPWARDDAKGNGLRAEGNMWGDDIGSSSGAGGLGLSGVGAGGAGRGEGIGFGSIGIIGHGQGTTGTGEGFGAGSGRLGRSHRARPPRVRMGATSVSGRLPPEVIQRIVRQNFGRFRLCYENGLKSNPNLQGRVSVRFVIGRDGGVSNVAGGGDLPDPAVISCVTRAFYGLSFPQPEGGIVTVSYPIAFTPGGDSATPSSSSWVPTASLRLPPRVVHLSGDEHWRNPESGRLVALREALQRQPRSRRAHDELIRGLLVHGIFDEALDAATRFSRLDPDLPAGYELLAYAAAATGDGRLAALAMATRAELEPESASAQRGAARAFEALGQLRRACAHYRSAAELEPSDDETAQSLGRCSDPNATNSELDDVSGTSWFRATLKCESEECATLIVVAPDGAVYSPWTCSAKRARSTRSLVQVPQRRAGTYRTILVGTSSRHSAHVELVADGTVRKLALANATVDPEALTQRTVASTQVRNPSPWW